MLLFTSRSDGLPEGASLEPRAQNPTVAFSSMQFGGHRAAWPSSYNGEKTTSEVEKATQPKHMDLISPKPRARRTCLTVPLWCFCRIATTRPWNQHHRPATREREQIFQLPLGLGSSEPRGACLPVLLLLAGTTGVYLDFCSIRSMYVVAGPRVRVVLGHSASWLVVATAQT